MLVTQTSPITLRQGANDNDALWSMLGRLWRRYRQWRGRRCTVATLRALDERTLSDIGLQRGEILSIVHDQRNERLRRYDERWWDPFSR